MNKPYPDSISPTPIVSTAMENKTLDVVNNAIAQQKIASFDFLHVDDRLDKEIDKYFSNYTGTDREILDI